MKRLVFCFVAVIAAAPSCSSQLPLAPSTIGRQGAPTLELAAISGHVYAEMPSGEPAIADVLITVQDSQGSKQTALSDHRGFYTVFVRSGNVLLTASKEGYQPQERRLAVKSDTVLNLSLPPA